MPSTSRITIAEDLVPELCYLCGAAITSDRNLDHVPPRQFYSQQIRQRYGTNLLTIPTHRSCNSSYQLDEEYFAHTMIPLVLDSYSGNSLFRELIDQYHVERNIPLSKRVFSEFEQRPSGLVIPGKIVKRFNADRVWRVVWKITRGLFAHEHGRILPESTPRLFKIVSVGEKPPPEFFLLPDSPTRSKYPGVFDYKYRQFTEINDVHLWAMLFWDRLIILISFHDPTCACNTCNPRKAEAEGVPPRSPARMNPPDANGDEIG